MTLLFYVLVVYLTFWCAEARRSDYVGSIRPYTYTSWGSWGHEDWCASGNYAYGFHLRIEGRRGSGDDSAVNGVKLFCRSYCGTHSQSVTSTVGPWGNWQTEKICPGHYFLKGASVRSEPRQGSGDDSAVNNYNFLCQNSRRTSQSYLLRGNGMTWGSWTSRKDCPNGSYICGIKTQMEPRQGSGDDSALNDARFYCCRLRKTSCYTYGRR